MHNRHLKANRAARFCGLICLSLALAACTGNRESAQLPNTGASLSAAEAQAGRLQGDVGELAAAFELGGAQVLDGGPIQQDFIPVAGQVLRINGADLQVYPFANEADRQQFSSTIAGDGRTIAGLHPAWPAQPYFWVSHNLLVLYVVGDPAIVSLVSQLLGEPLVPLDSTP